MPVRRRHKVGDWLVTDDESGIVNYRSEMVRRWDGLMVRQDQYETRQPQEFVKAKTDPYAVSPIRPDEFTRSVSNTIQYRIGGVGIDGVRTLTNIKTPMTGAAAHLFKNHFHIGPTGIASVTRFGTPNQTASGIVPLDASGIASVTAFGQHQITLVPDGFNPVIGNMEIGPTFEVF